MDKESVIQELREMYPHGHPDFVRLAVDEIELHSQKNHDYARGGPPLGNFDRRTDILRIYSLVDNPVIVALLDMLKQLDSAIWMLVGKYEGEVEDVTKRLQDVSVYAKLAQIIHAEMKNAKDVQ